MMSRPSRRKAPCFVALLIAWSVAITASLAAQPADLDVRVATASNFVTVMKEIAVRFEQATGHRITLIIGSTGKHYAHVVNGAPFDVLFAADTLRPALLERSGHALAGSRFTYAMGKLVLWSSTPGLVDSEAVVLKNGGFRHMAIANPALAPYGAAAREVMEAMGLWEFYSQRLVRGENISQAFNFVRSGNAELGFVAYSQVADPNHPAGGSFWIVPPTLYSPIEQQAVLLRDTDAARRFLAFVRSDEALSIIQAHGYDIPDAH